MPKFRKKPVVIEARQVEPVKECLHSILDWINEHADDQTAWLAFEGLGATAKLVGIVIPTLEGEMTAEVGDWVIEGVNGEFYPCKPDIFAKTYEPA